MARAFFIMSVNPYDIIRDPNSNNNDQISQDAWNRENDDLLSSWFNPGSQQREEFAQQILMQQMQNNWNSEDARIERMKKAGINPNVAAAGIAGAGASPSTGSPNSAVGAGAQGVASAAQAAGAVNEAVNAGVNAYEKLSLTGVERDKRKAEIRDLLAAATHNEWLAYSISELLPLQKENERADTWLKLANFDKAREEKKLINKRIDESDAHIKELLAHADELEKQGNYADALKERTDAETAQIQLQNDKLQWDKDFRDRWHFDNTKPVDNALIEAMMFEDGEANGVVNTIGKAVSDLAYSERKGFNIAEIEDAYMKVYSELKAKADIDSEFAPYFAMIEANKQSIIEFIKMLTDNPDDIAGIIGKLANLMSQIGLSSQIQNGVVNNAHRPKAGITINNVR